MATWSKLDLGCVRLNQGLEPSGVDCTMSVQNCVMQAIFVRASLNVEASYVRRFCCDHTEK